MARQVIFGSYEVGELERYLEKLKDFIKKSEIKGQEKWDSRKYDIQRIDVLISRIKGNNFKPNYSIQKTSYKEKIANETKGLNKKEKDYEVVEDWRGK